MVTGCSSPDYYVDLYSFCQSQDVGCCMLVMDLKDSIPFRHDFKESSMLDTILTVSFFF